MQLSNPSNLNQNAVSTLKNCCVGRWNEIIAILAPELQTAIINRPDHVPCPVHGGKVGLRCFPDFDETGGMVCNTCGPFSDGIDVLRWIHKWSFPETVEQIESCLDDIKKYEDSTLEYKDTTLDISCDSEKREHRLLQLREQLMPLDAPEAEPGLLYLKNRGLSLITFPDNLLFHPNLPHYDEGTPCYFPASCLNN